MNIKPNPNHKIYLQVLSDMTPCERLKKAFELSELSKKLFLSGLKKRFPEKTEKQMMAVYIERILLKTKKKLQFISTFIKSEFCCQRVCTCNFKLY